MARILVVEDQDYFREPLAAYLKVKGFEVIEAEGEDEAKAKILGGGFDVLITDKDMPDKDAGIRLLKSPELSAKRIPVKIIWSGSDDFVGLERELDREINAYKFSKSVDIDKIIDFIHEQLQRGTGLE